MSKLEKFRKLYNATRSEAEVEDDRIYALYSILEAVVGDREDYDVNDAIEDIVNELDLKISVENVSIEVS